jgi:hypothetical protein
VAEAQQHPLTRPVGDRPVALVIELLLNRLCLLKAMANVSEELLPFLHGARHCCHACVPGLIGP